MGNFYDDDDREDEGPVIRTQAELTLQNLLQKQLATSGRLEQVEFEEVTHSMHCIGHGFSGVGTLAQFRENELLQKKENNDTQLTNSLPHWLRLSKSMNKRKRYGPDPSFLQHALDEEEMRQQQLNQIKETSSGQQTWSRHSEELEASLLRGKDKLKAISHLSAGESTCRKPLLKNVDLSEFCKGTTPQERARGKVDQECTRSAAEVFSSPAPDILDLHAYLEEKQQTQDNGHAKVQRSVSITTTENLERNNTECKEDLQSSSNSGMIENAILDTDILSNKLSEDEIRELPGGKFANYTPGAPSHILYIKNLSPDVKDTDLAALFIRFQSVGKKLLFRLMQRGRMKGQAFVKFPDQGANIGALHNCVVWVSDLVISARPFCAHLCTLNHQVKDTQYEGSSTLDQPFSELYGFILDTETATLALQLTNGFIMKGKPMVIQYGRGAERDN